MTAFAPLRVCRPHHFDIRADGHGRWVVRDRDGLVGGTFMSHDGARRFALFEVGGDAAFVHEAHASARWGAH